MEQMSTIVEVIKEGGLICIFLPEYHSELNWIEMVWTFIKQIKQQVRVKIVVDLDPSMLKVEQYIRESLDALHGKKKGTLKSINGWQIATCTLQLGATGKLLKFLVQEYKSHRSTQSDRQKI